MWVRLPPCAPKFISNKMKRVYYITYKKNRYPKPLHEICKNLDIKYVIVNNKEIWERGDYKNQFKKIYDIVNGEYIKVKVDPSYKDIYMPKLKIYDTKHIHKYGLFHQNDIMYALTTEQFLTDYFDLLL